MSPTGAGMQISSRIGTDKEDDANVLRCKQERVRK
jgi:hypothetical protein